jgi:hypothetical protein
MGQKLSRVSKILIAPNNSLEATWEAAEFAIEEENLVPWIAREQEFPGASAQSR